MTHMVANDTMLALLNQIKDLTEIRDASGKVVGYFAPLSSELAGLYARMASHLDPKEIQRRKTEPGPRRTTREVFEHLRSLTQDEQLRSVLNDKIERLTERDRCDTP